MFTYKKRNTFLQGLHPLTITVIMLSYMIGFLSISNPLYLGIIVISLLFLSLSDGSLKELSMYGKIMIPFVIFMIIINPILVKNGRHVIFSSRIRFPIIGNIRITLEAMFFGLISGIKILTLTLAFGFANLVIHPDKSFGYFSKFLNKSAFLMSMIINLFPRLLKSFNNIAEVEKIRGNYVEGKSFKDKIKSKGSIINILFLSSLEDSNDMAESMYSRGYGMGNRSTYFVERFKKIDIFLLLSSIITIVLLLVTSVKGINSIDFYPVIENPFNKISFLAILYCFTFFIPVVVNWWWNKWRL